MHDKNSNTSPDSNDAFPVAIVMDRPRSAAHLSKLWWLTGACLLLAIGLVWSSSRDPGVAITIQFDQGHGLKVGDPARHRGIDIGKVTAITLSEDLSSIVADVTIDSSAASVATEGSRFWIVRPQIDISGVSGLDTAVGSKYIAVIPGKTSKPQTQFRGLAARPADDKGSDGIELVLRGEDRHGIHPGAPVTWRGIDVGRVLSASLSPDALEVDVRVRIDEGYRRLVTPGSKFWVTSGIDIDVGVTGVNINAESLATIARGGVAMISTEARSDAEIPPGSVFKLHDQVDDDWIDSAAGINLLQRTPPATLRILATWRDSFLGIGRNQQASSLGFVIAGPNNQAVALLPADMTVADNDATEGTFSVGYQTGDKVLPVQTQPTGANPDAGPVASRVFPHELPGGRVVMPDRIRIASAPEDCFVVRNSEAGDGTGNATMQMIGRQMITIGDQGWDVASSGLGRSLWHGAPVISATDERIIGMLIVDKTGARIVPIPVQ